MADPERNNLINYYGRLPVMGTGYWENEAALTENCVIFFYDQLPFDRDWQVVHAKLGRAGVRFLNVSKSFDYRMSYTLYGTDLIRDPRYTFAYYLVNQSPDRLVPWLRLISDDGAFRLFEVR